MSQAANFLFAGRIARHGILEDLDVKEHQPGNDLSRHDPGKPGLSLADVVALEDAAF